MVMAMAARARSRFAHCSGIVCACVVKFWPTIPFVAGMS